MAVQSPLEQFKSARIGRNALIALAAGMVIGLALGLLVGWVWWPVDWQGANPATTAPTAPTSFSPDLRASYMGAVADAYAMNPDNSAATALAAQRLSALGGDMPTNFKDALSYYGNQANGSTQVNNLTALASVVGVPLQGPAGVVAPSTPAVAGQASQPAGATPASGTGGDAGWGGWLVVLLAALLLVGGGGYILWRVAQQRTPGDEPVTAFTDEDLSGGAGPATASFDRDSLSPLPATVAAPTGSGATRSRQAPTGGPFGFDPEGDDDVYPAAGTRAVSTPSGAAPMPDDDDAALEDDDEDASLDVYPPAAGGYPPTAAGYVTAVGASAPFTGARAEPRQPSAPSSGAPATDATPAAAGVATQRSTPLPPLKPAVPSRYERYAPVDSHTATYQVGIADFDYTKNVENPEGTGYIGEYGIGISNRHGLLDNNLEQVVALEVYLFDKTDETQLLTVTRALLSEYAHDNLYSFFDREKQSADPITAQIGTSFQLEGRQLLLDCTVTDVRYTNQGVFKNVVVDMVLKRRA